MSLHVTVHSNQDDALVAWRADPWSPAWVGFAVEKKNLKTGEVTALNNRIPAQVGQGQTPAQGVSSFASPIRRCIWTDHAIAPMDDLAYRVTPLIADASGGFTPAPEGPSEWTAATIIGAADSSGVSAYFNRGVLMSQIVSRFVNDDISTASLSTFRTSLANPGFPPRAYLSGHAREALLGFLGDADRRGSQVFAAVYEINDQEIIDAIKAFGARGSVLIGNGDATKPHLAEEFSGAGLTVHERDLSKRGASSPSVHNKFVVEVSPAGNAVRVLTGSTNWTTTALCTQLNNVLVVERPVLAQRFLDQWRALVAAGDDMPDALKQANAQWTSDGPAELAFAATPDQEDFAPVLEAIRNAKQGILFLMFMPGESPLLEAAMTRSAEADGPYVRGVVSTVVTTTSGTITHHGAQVIMNGATSSSNDDVLMPVNVPQNNRPTWAFDEFNRQMFTGAHLIAIVHSKTIVIDPFSPDCVVITGSHNFSAAASARNDENLVIVRGDQALAQAYAVHIQGVYDAYSWRAFLQNNGDPNTLYQGLADWAPGGKKARELDFWTVLGGAGA